MSTGIISAPTAFTGLGGPTAASAMAALKADPNISHIFRARTGDMNLVGAAGSVTGSIASGSNNVVISAVASGQVTLGSILSGAGVPDGETIGNMYSSTGGAGTYGLGGGAVSSAVASEAMTLSQAIDSLIDLKGTGQLLQADALRYRPAYQAGVMQGYSLAQQALSAPVLSPSQFEAAYFASASIDGMALTGAQPDPTSPYTWVFIFKSSGALGDAYIGGMQAGNSAKAFLQGQSSSGKLLWNYAGNAFPLSGGVVDGSAWNVAIISYDGAGNFNFRVNGVAQQLTGVGAQAAISQPFRIGSLYAGGASVAPFKGWIRNAMLCPANLLDGSAGHTASLNELITSCEKIHGLSA